MKGNQWVMWRGSGGFWQEPFLGLKGRGVGNLLPLLCVSVCYEVEKKYTVNPEVRASEIRSQRSEIRATEVRASEIGTTEGRASELREKERKAKDVITPVE